MTRHVKLKGDNTIAAETVSVGAAKRKQIRPKVAHGQIEWWERRPNYLINFYNIYIDQIGLFTKLNIKNNKQRIIIKGATKSQLNYIMTCSMSVSRFFTIALNVITFFLRN